MPYSIHHDLEIKESPCKVFQAVSEPKHLVNWWPLKCSGIPKENEEYNFFFTPEYDWYGTVSKYEKNKSFHIKMTKADIDWNPTSFGFDLEQKNDTTLIKFWHIGWPECNAHFRRSSFCWAMLLNGLKNYVERGIIIPFEERE
jgi:uncharacterized protein YndB with AHSA1/START domain